MADRGYILLYRGWRRSGVFKDEPCSEREAWVWLLEEAAYKPRTREVNGVTVHIRRGQAALSSRFLARAWRWEEPRVRRFLKRLEQHGMIVIERVRPVNVLTVANYDSYQPGGSVAKSNAPSDAPTDALSDAGPDARKAAETPGVAAGADAGSDAGADAPSDAPTDANENEGSLMKDSKRGGAQSAPAKRKRAPPEGHKLPENWRPKLKHYELGRELGLGTNEVDYEADKFRDHFLPKPGKDGRKSDWDRTFNNWLRKAVEYGKRTPAGKPPQGNRPQAGSLVGTTRRLVHGSGG